MNKELRIVWLELANLSGAGFGLCNFCKFAWWEGNSCCDSQLYCDHPLPVINGEDDNCDHMNDVWGDGADCWGFRPRYSLQEAGIIVSIRSNGDWPYKNKKGEWVAIIPSKNDLMYV